MSKELQDELRAAFESQEGEKDDDTTVATGGADGGEGDDKEPETTPEKPVDAPADGDPAPEKEAPEEVTEPEAGVKLDKERAPTSWNAKVREKWKELPEEVRAEVIRREESHVNGIRKLQDEVAPIRQFTESLGAVIQEATGLGVAPAQYIHNLAAAERGLRTGAPEQKFETLLALADQYGIPLRQAINGTAGKELLPAKQQPAQLPPEVLRELEEARQFRTTYQAQTVQQQVAEFSKGKEFFEDVRDQMAALFDSGQASDLSEAYDKAVWLHPEVRQVLIDREKAATTANGLKQRQAAAAGAAAKAGGQNDIKVDVDDGDDSIEALVRKSMAAGTGRL